MITTEDLKAAIAHYRGETNPDINTCIKLAACLVCLKEEEGDRSDYSYLPAPTEKVGYYSDTEFGRAVAGKDTTAILRLIDELMITLSAIQPRLYAGVMRRLDEI